MNTKKHLFIFLFLFFAFVLKAQDMGELLKLIQPQFTAQNNAFFAEMQKQNITFITSKTVICTANITEVYETKIDIKNRLIYEVVTEKDTPQFRKETLYSKNGIVCKNSNYCNGMPFQTFSGNAAFLPKHLFSEITVLDSDPLFREFRLVGVQPTLDAAIFNGKKTEFLEKLKNSKDENTFKLNAGAISLSVRAKCAVIKSVKFRVNSDFIEVENKFFSDNQNLLREKEKFNNGLDTPKSYGFKVLESGGVYKISLTEYYAKYLYSQLKDTLDLPILQLNKKDIRQLVASDISQILEKSDFLEVVFAGGKTHTFKKLSSRETFAIYVAKMKSKQTEKTLKTLQK